MHRQPRMYWLRILEALVVFYHVVATHAKRKGRQRYPWTGRLSLIGSPVAAAMRSRRSSLHSSSRSPPTNGADQDCM